MNGKRKKRKREGGRDGGGRKKTIKRQDGSKGRGRVSLCRKEGSEGGRFECKDRGKEVGNLWQGGQKTILAGGKERSK